MTLKELERLMGEVECRHPKFGDVWEDELAGPIADMLGEHGFPELALQWMPYGENYLLELEARKIQYSQLTTMCENEELVFALTVGAS